MALAVDAMLRLYKGHRHQSAITSCLKLTEGAPCRCIRLWRVFLCQFSVMQNHSKCEKVEGEPWRLFDARGSTEKQKHNNQSSLYLLTMRHCDMGKGECLEDENGVNRVGLSLSSQAKNHEKSNYLFDWLLNWSETNTIKSAAISLLFHHRLIIIEPDWVERAAVLSSCWCRVLVRKMTWVERMHIYVYG